MNTQSKGVLQIIGAAYGLKRVTMHVIKLVDRQASPETLSVLASNRVFGDTWVGNAKTLTVVYRYDHGPTQVATATEGQTLTIGEPQFEQSIPVSKGDAAESALTVWGASYGPADVSASVRSLVAQPCATLSLVADDATFGDTWKGVRKTLVIVASYARQVPFIDIVIEGTSYALRYRPALRVLGAFYGRKDVTDIVQSRVDRRSLSITACSSIFGDGWPGSRKTLHVIYQYAGDKPRLATVTENQTIDIQYSGAGVQLALDPRALNILVAAYGSFDVTTKVAALVTSQGLSFTPDGAAFGDPRPGVARAFSMVYSWGEGEVASINVAEGTPVSIPRPEPASACEQTVVPLAGLFAAGDEIKLQTAAGGYWSPGPDGQVMALGVSGDAAEVFTVGVPGCAESAITLRCRDGSHVVADVDGTLHAGGSAQDAARIVVSLQVNGTIHISIVGGSGAPFIAVTANGALAVNGSYSASFFTCFHLLLNPAQEGNVNHLQAVATASMLDGPVDMKLVQVGWGLTIGCFQAIGVSARSVDAQQIGTGLYRFLRRYPRVMNQIAILIATTDCNRTAASGALLVVLKGIHEAGILMPVLRMALSSGGWVDVASIILTVMTKVLGGATKGGATTAGGPVAGLDDWAYRTTVDVIDYINSTGGTALMLAYERMVSADQPVLRRMPASVVPGRLARNGSHDSPGSGAGPMMRSFAVHP